MDRHVEELSLDDSKGEPQPQYIFRRYRRCPKTGKILDAWQYGYKAWKIRIA